MKVFVINLKRSPERRAFMKKQLDALGMDYEFIEATDGKELSDEEIKNIYDEEASLKFLRVPLTRGEIGCAHSHIKTYQKIVNDNLDYALVLEDDSILEPSLFSLLKNNEFVSQSHFDWLQIDYARVGWPFFSGWLRGAWIYTKQRPTFALYTLLKLPYISVICIYEWLREKFNRNNPAIVSFGRPIYLASAYLITNAGAKKLIKLGTPIRFAADMLPNKARILTNFKLKAISPPLAHQDRSFDSEIGIR